MTNANPLAALKPYNGVTNPAGQQAALQSAAKFLLSRYEASRCDSSGVSDCVRCNSVYLAKAVLRLTAPRSGSEDDAETLCPTCWGRGYIAPPRQTLVNDLKPDDGFWKNHDTGDSTP